MPFCSIDKSMDLDPSHLFEYFFDVLDKDLPKNGIILKMSSWEIDLQRF